MLLDAVDEGIGAKHGVVIGGLLSRKFFPGVLALSIKLSCDRYQSPFAVFKVILCEHVLLGNHTCTLVLDRLRWQSNVLEQLTKLEGLSLEQTM